MALRRRLTSQGRRPDSKGLPGRPATQGGDDTDVPLGGEWASRERRPWVNQSQGRNAKKPGTANTVDSIHSVYGVEKARPSSKERLSRSSDGSKKEAAPAASMTKSRAIESWLDGSLNHALSQKQQAAGPNAASDQDMVGKLKDKFSHKNPGMNHFKVDGGNLASLGLDQESIERIHRTLFVYSQGIHAVLQDVVKHSHDRSQSLLCLWKALSAVLECGQENSEGEQSESLADIIKKGNEEELRRTKKELGEQIVSLQSQRDQCMQKNKEMEMEVQNLRVKAESAGQNCEMYERDCEIAQHKHELEIRNRTQADINCLERNGWITALEEDLVQARTQVRYLTNQLSEANKARGLMDDEVVDLRAKVRAFEIQQANYEQQSLQDTQQRARIESLIVQSKARLDKEKEKTKDLEEKLQKASDDKHDLQDQLEKMERQTRTLQTNLDHEIHFKEEGDREKERLNKRCEVLDKEVTEIQDISRTQRKELYELRGQVRYQEIESKRIKDELEQKKEISQKLQVLYKNTLGDCRKLEAENESLALDVEALDKRVKVETDARKKLEGDKVLLEGNLATSQTELAESHAACANLKKELLVLTNKMVKIEASETYLRNAMGQQAHGHTANQKAMAKTQVMLEKVISDERQARRTLVDETQKIDRKCQETELDLEDRDLEITMLKQQIQEAELEADRLRIVYEQELKMHEETRVLVEKNNAAVANCDGELMQLQVILESERCASKEQIAIMTQSYEVARAELIKEIDMWQLRFEDALSLLHFNPLNEKIKTLEKKIEDLKGELDHALHRNLISLEHIKKLETDVADKVEKVQKVQKESSKLKHEKAGLITELAEVKQHWDRTSLRLSDYEERAMMNSHLVDTQKDERKRLEGIISDLKLEIKRLEAIINKPKADSEVQASVKMQSGEIQTDLSYQYLESADHLHEGSKRLEMLDHLKKASDFVEGTQDETRDFTVRMRSSVDHRHTEIGAPGSPLLNFKPDAEIADSAGSHKPRQSHMVSSKGAASFPFGRPSTISASTTTSVPLTHHVHTSSVRHSLRPPTFQQTTSTPLAKHSPRTSSVGAGAASAAAKRLTAKSEIEEELEVDLPDVPLAKGSRKIKPGSNSRATRLVTVSEEGFIDPVVPRLSTGASTGRHSRHLVSGMQSNIG
eukprot:gnl/MRDRNA2_/MRDRNA2_99412_c0_seq1.p1 gnl/MRDRNA2_/MRDRNA2_99412_c0~~gnl/MRDRNA2_/MRDRNA2_99412_c0_seq1.p1  ORF type:complete len:1158 (-),score=272.79 gnl/MRDRNA2_/MRDRNA2_99412_c0_seq1:53-3526(-)